MGVRKATVVSCSIKKKQNCFLLSVRGLLCWWQHLVLLLCESTSNVYYRNTPISWQNQEGKEQLQYSVTELPPLNNQPVMNGKVLFVFSWLPFLWQGHGEGAGVCPSCKRANAGYSPGRVWAQGPIWVFGGSVPGSWHLHGVLLAQLRAKNHLLLSLVP